MKRIFVLFIAVCLLTACLVSCQSSVSNGDGVPNREDQIPVTTAPQETTAAPQETTAAPQETTAAPQETTAAPQETTAEPQETTAAPQGNDVPKNYCYLPVKLESGGTTAEYKYNENGHLIAIMTVYPNGQTETTEYEVDGFGNIVHDSYYVSEYNLKVTIDYEYDKNGLLIRETDTYSDGRVETDTYEYEFDTNGNVTRQIRTSSGGLKIFNDYEYDQRGNQIKCTTSNSYSEKNKMIYEYEYDDNGYMIRMVQCQIDNGEERPQVVVNYQYDEYGKQIYDAEAGYEYTCDENGNLTRTFTVEGAIFKVEYRLMHTPNGIPDWMSDMLP